MHEGCYDGRRFSDTARRGRNEKQILLRYAAVCLKSRHSRASGNPVKWTPAFAGVKMA
jgi:hypothetical protein